MPRRRTGPVERFREKHGQYWHVAPASAGRKWTALGPDYAIALLEWARLEGDACSASTFAVVAARYERDVLPTKAPKTQDEYARQLRDLVKVFGAQALDSIKPQHIRRYLDKRSAKVAANREIALLSTVFNHAREWGYTAAANPCAGVRRTSETGRKVYVTDDEYKRIRSHADALLSDAMELAYLTGQRVADVLAFSRTDVRDGALHVRQKKTGAVLRIELSGALGALVSRLLSDNGGRVVSMALLRTRTGRPLNKGALQVRFTKARKAAGLEHIQFRDLRAKAATDLEDLAAAQKLLGHSSRAMTEHYVKGRIGERVSPVKKK